MRNRGPTDTQQLYRLNPALVDWAVRDTKDVVLDDSPGMKKMRDAYTGFAKEKSTLTVYWFFAPPAILISRHQGRPPAQSLATKDSPEHLGGFLPSLEAAFRVGNKVISDIVNHWEEYSNDVPK